MMPLFCKTSEKSGRFFEKEVTHKKVLTAAQWTEAVSSHPFPPISQGTKRIFHLSASQISPRQKRSLHQFLKIVAWYCCCNCFTFRSNLEKSFKTQPEMKWFYERTLRCILHIEIRHWGDSWGDFKPLESQLIFCEWLLWKQSSDFVASDKGQWTFKGAEVPGKCRELYCKCPLTGQEKKESQKTMWQINSVLQKKCKHVRHLIMPYFKKLRGGGVMITNIKCAFPNSLCWLLANARFTVILLWNSFHIFRALHRIILVYWGFGS